MKNSDISEERKKYFEDNVGGVRIDHFIGQVNPFVFANKKDDETKKIEHLLEKIESLNKKLDYINKECKTNYSSLEEVDWWYISTYQKLSESFIREFADKIDWYYMSKYQKLSESFIKEFNDGIKWQHISLYQKLSEFRKL